MSEPAPEPVPEPAPETHGLMARVRAWFEKDVFPEIADIRIQAANALIATRKIAPVLEEAVSVLGDAVKAADPAADPAVAALIPRIEAVVAEAAKIAADLAASGI